MTQSTDKLSSEVATMNEIVRHNWRSVDCPDCSEIFAVTLL